MGPLLLQCSSAASVPLHGQHHRPPDNQFETDAYHVGALESSKSAMKTEAPEFRALMTILRSTGPVISTRLSCRS